MVVKLIEGDEQRIELLEEIYLESFENSDDFAAIVNPSNRIILKVNPRGLEMFEANNESDLVGNDSLDLRAESIGLEELQAIWAILDKGETYRNEVKYKTLKGKIFPGYLKIRRILIKNWELMLIRITDISDLYQYREDVQLYQNRLKDAMEGMGESFWEWKLPDHEVYISPRMREMLQVKSTNSVDLAKEWQLRIHPEDVSNFNDKEGNISRIWEKTQTIVEFRWKMQSGHYEWMQSKGRIVGYAEDGVTPIRISGVTENIDQRKKMEERLQLYAKNLEQMNSDLKQLAYITTHDLKEPIRSITGFLQLVKRRNEDKWDSSSEEYVESAIEGCHRLSRIIEDLLDYSKIEMGEKSIELIDVNEVIEGTIKNLERVIKEKNVTIEVKKLPKLLGNKTQFARLFQNLVSNGIKYNKSENPIIEISYDEDFTYHLFHVKDNGIGIDKPYYSEIYRIFKRLHSSDEYDGIGMGLAICKKIVESHNGAIWHDSSPSEGTTFHFTIKKEWV